MRSFERAIATAPREKKEKVPAAQSAVTGYTAVTLHLGSAAETAIIGCDLGARCHLPVPSAGGLSPLGVLERS